MRRNGISSASVDPGTVERVVGWVLDRPVERAIEKKTKRFFSETFEDLMLKKFSVDKQAYATADLKTVKLSKLCSEFQITKEQATLLMNCLEECKLIARVMKNVSYECTIKEGDIELVKQLLPKAIINHCRLNLLNISNE